LFFFFFNKVDSYLDSDFLKNIRTKSSFASGGKEKAGDYIFCNASTTEMGICVSITSADEVPSEQLSQQCGPHALTVTRRHCSSAAVAINSNDGEQQTISSSTGNPAVGVPPPVLVVDVSKGFCTEDTPEAQPLSFPASGQHTPHPLASSSAATPSSINPNLLASSSSSTPHQLRRRRSNSNGQQQQQHATPRRSQVGGSDFFSTIVGVSTPQQSAAVVAPPSTTLSLSSPPKLTSAAAALSHSPAAHPPASTPPASTHHRMRSSSAGPISSLAPDYSRSGNSGSTLFRVHGNNPFVAASSLFAQSTQASHTTPPAATASSPQRSSAMPQRRVSDLNTATHQSGHEDNADGAVPRGRIASSVMGDDDEEGTSTAPSCSISRTTVARTATSNNNNNNTNNRNVSGMLHIAPRSSNDASTTASQRQRSAQHSSASISAVSLGSRHEDDDVLGVWNPLTVTALGVDRDVSTVNRGITGCNEGEDDDDDEAVPCFYQQRHSLLSAGSANASGTTAALEPHQQHNRNAAGSTSAADDDDDDIIANGEEREGVMFPGSAPSAGLKVSFHDFVFRLDSPSLGFKSNEVADASSDSVVAPHFQHHYAPTGGSTPIMRPTTSTSLRAPPFLQLPPPLREGTSPCPCHHQGQQAPLSTLSAGGNPFFLAGSYSAMRQSTATTNSGGGVTTVTDASSRSMMAMSGSSSATAATTTYAPLLPRDGMSHREQRARKAL
jgi:hypothetical protein